MAANHSNEAADDKKSAAKFSKEKILNSKAYQGKRDLIDALLEDGKEYTRTDVDKLISGYKKREVTPRYHPKKKTGGDQ